MRTSSKIVQTFLSFPGARSAERLQEVIKDFEYFERYIEWCNVQVVPLIQDLILSQEIPNPELTPFDLRGNGFLITQGGAARYPEIFGGKRKYDCGLRIEHILDSRDHSKFSVHINRFGYNIINSKRFEDRGVEIDFYNLPRDLAQKAAHEFQKVQAPTRKEALIEYGKAEDAVSCNVDKSEQSIREQFRRDGNAVVGVNHDLIWRLEATQQDTQTFGVMNGYFGVDSFNLKLRINRQGVKYRLPSFKD
jgi:hypothetical protein